MACKIKFKNEYMTDQEFQSNLNNPVFMDEIVTSEMATKYTELLNETNPATNEVYTQNEILQKIKDEYNSTKSLKEIQRSIARWIAQFDGPVYTPQEVENNTNLQKFNNFIKKQLSEAKTLKLWKFFDEWLFAGAIKRRIPELGELMRRAQTFADGELHKAKRYTKRLNRITKSLGKKLTASDKLAITSLIRGGDPNNLTLERITDPAERAEVKAEIMEITDNIRLHIDTLTRKLKGLGFLSEHAIEIFEDNEGKYVARVYRSQLDGESWWKKLTDPTDVAMATAFRAGKQFYRKNLQSRLNTLDTKTIPNLEKRLSDLQDQSPSTIEELKKVRDQAALIEKQIKQLTNRRNKIENLLAPGNEAQLELYIKGDISGDADTLVQGEFSPVRTDQGLFKKRKDIPKVVRNLMGEINDPVEAYQATIRRMAAFHSKYGFQKGFADMGEGILYSKVQNGEFRKKFTISQLPGMTESENLAGVTEIYVPLTVERQLKALIGKRSGMLEVANTMNGIIKWNQTVGNIVTQERNFFSAFFFLANAGNFVHTKHGRRGHQMLFKELGRAIKDGALNRMDEIRSKTGSEKLRTYRNSQSDMTMYIIDTLMEVGALGSPEVAEIDAYFKNTKLSNAIEKLKNSNIGLVSGTTKTISGAIEMMNILYAGGDNLIKLGNFMAEASRAADIYYNTTYEALYKEAVRTGDFSKIQKVNNRATDLTRNTIPNYGETWEFVNQLRRSSVIAAFPAFMAEQIRTQLNNTKRAFADIKEGREMEMSSDPAVRRMGKKLRRAGGNRLISTIAIGSSAIWADNIFRTVFELIDEPGDDEPDTEYENKVILKHHSPEWVEKSLLVNRGDGKYMYIDPNTFHPYGPLYNFGQGWETAEDDDFTSKFLSAMRPFVEAFLSPDIGASLLLGAANNENQYGGPISNADPGSYQYVKDFVMYLGENMAVPGTVKQRNRYYREANKIIVAERNIDSYNRDIPRAKNKDQVAKLRRLIEREYNKIENAQKTMNSILLSHGLPTSQIPTPGIRRVYFDLGTSFKYKKFSYDDEVKRIKANVNQKVKDAEGDVDLINELHQEAIAEYRSLLDKYRDMYEETKKYTGYDGKYDMQDQKFHIDALAFITGETDEYPEFNTSTIKRQKGEPNLVPKKKDNKKRSVSRGVDRGFSRGFKRN